MTTLPASGYWEDNSRTEGEGKQWGEDIRDVIAELVGGSAASMLTISSGVILPTTANHTVEGEGAASDDLSNITTTNTPDGRMLLLVAYNASHIITVKHAAGGAGQIHMLDDADADLDATDAWILLKRAGTDWYEVYRSKHGDIHERAGYAEIDGDHLDIDLTPTYYVPSTTPSEAANADDLAAHLYGIDQMLGWLGRGYLQRSKFTYNGGATAYTIKCEPAMYMCKDKICQWVTELTTTAVGSPVANDWFYLYLDYSAITSTTAITNAELIWSSTEPVWNDTYMGWYNSDDRCIFAVRANSIPDNILAFYHDGKDYVLYDNDEVDFSLADPNTDWSTTQALTIPSFCTKALCDFRLAYDADATTGHWRPGDSSDSDGHTVGTVSSSAVHSQNTDIVFTDSSQQIDLKITDATGEIRVTTKGFFLPIGL